LCAQDDIDVAAASAQSVFGHVAPYFLYLKLDHHVLLHHNPSSGLYVYENVVTLHIYVIFSL
jgi:hypothetical protein